MVPELHTPLILGYTWLHSHNPRIDWVAGEIVLPEHAAAFVATRPVSPPRAACDFLMSGEAYEALVRNPHVRRTLRVWKVQSLLRDSQPARLAVARGVNGYSMRDPGVYKVFDDWFNPRGVSVDACMEAAVASLTASRVLANIDCPSCSAAHLDNYALALEEH